MAKKVVEEGEGYAVHEVSRLPVAVIERLSVAGWSAEKMIMRILQLM